MTNLTDHSARALTRRQFLAGLSDAAKCSLIVLSVPAILTACGRTETTPSAPGTSNYSILSDELARTLDAVTARIVPTDATPGAREAGAVGFIDHVLADGRQDQLPVLQSGADDLNAAASRLGAGSFAELSAEQQDQLLTEIETTPFFGTLRYLTVASLFALPQYGGNGPDTGFTLIGMTHAHAYVPPFGYYDADYAARGE
jgi:gluconate 2-dehydrogenase gamma chain